MRDNFRFWILDFGLKEKAAILLVAIMLLAPQIRAEGPCPERTEKYVNDFAGILAETDRKTLGEMLKNLETQSGIEMTIVTIRKAADYPDCAKDAEAFAPVLFSMWRTGGSGGSGIMMFVSQEDRKMQVKLGDNYSPFFDTVIQKVVETKMLPFFRDGHYSRGIYEGAREVAKTAARGVSIFEVYGIYVIAGLLALICAAGLIMLIFGKKKPPQRGARPAVNPGSFGGGAEGEW